MKDLFGKAILDYQTGNAPENLITETSISEEDEMDVSYLFRSYDAMPALEQKALQMAQGKVLDVGCGAGSHSLYLQNERGLDVTAIDMSANAIAGDVMEHEGGYDTILVLMNGAGMCGKLKRISGFLYKLKSLLNDGGQILLDSSDIIYMFDEDEDGGNWIPSDIDYYGEVIFNVTYKGEKEKPFNWMYIDYNTLQNAAHGNKLQSELILEGEHYDYLAKLTI